MSKTDRILRLFLDAESLIQYGKFSKLMIDFDQKYKDLIEAVVESHEAEADTGVMDPVEGKGKGLVFLLHGVGKTLTTETVAAKKGRPLFVVSVAGTGPNASSAEQNLEKVFKLATR
ncbi:hypothetical protein DL766_002334 [Monosporascus sp. MC13-8B]|nr:hypothetical protein DL766_002334 [Monosporascus sp. MC13-8B]